MLAGVRDLLVVEMGQSFVAANKKAINRMIEEAATKDSRGSKRPSGGGKGGGKRKKARGAEGGDSDLELSDLGE